ncbi:hypothetical protein, partial [Comamonas aquatica]|uniref:hypothetical protein n=1 Tax=Comamonas aquatica TaxID=225991 RepID=UPI00244BDAAF
VGELPAGVHRVGEVAGEDIAHGGQPRGLLAGANGDGLGQGAGLGSEQGEVGGERRVTAPSSALRVRA